MDYVDKSDIDVFTMKLTLVMYVTGEKTDFTVNDQIFSSKKKSVLKLVVL